MATPDAFLAAHARVLHDRSLQFHFAAAPKPPKPPSWLVAAIEALGRLLKALGPAIPIVLWIVLGSGVLLVLVAVFTQFLAPIRRKSEAGSTMLSGAEGWRPTVARALALLEDADRLAAEGRYAEAAHVLLHRSIAEVEGKRPGVVGPSTTSRDIAALDEVPPAPRAAFARIAAVVEQGVFAGRPVDAQGWAACRDAYARFAFPEGWAPPAAPAVAA